MSQRTARAAVYDAPNAPFAIREYPLRDVHEDEALVRIAMSTICRSDIHSYHGHRPNPCPGILGHEIIGVIDQLGGHIQRDLRGDALAVGDRDGVVKFVEFECTNFVGKASPIASAHPDDAKALRFLKREIRVDPSTGWEYEPDPRHAEGLVKRLGLDDPRLQFA